MNMDHEHFTSLPGNSHLKKVDELMFFFSNQLKLQNSLVKRCGIVCRHELIFFKNPTYSIH